MRRWDRLLDAYVEEYRARGLSPQSVAYTQARLERWGRWLKRRRPRVAIEHIDAELITRYVASCSSFRAKATVYATLSTMRGFGDYLVRQGLWKINPLRWMKGPKVTPYSRVPKRIDHEHMEAMWREAANRHGKYSSHLWITVLALLYGTGLRRGELARVYLDAFNYGYDNLNRIAYGYTDGNLWGETYQIDPWGNLNKILAYTGKPQGENLNQQATEEEQSCQKGDECCCRCTSTVLYT